MYLIRLTSDAIKNVKALPKAVKNSLRKALEDEVANDPEGCSLPLSGPLLEGFRSYHWREYRVVYRVFHELTAIAIVGVGERKPGEKSDVYRRIERLAESGKLAELVLSSYREIQPPR